jgi:hypothetical protein
VNEINPATDDSPDSPPHGGNGESAPFGNGDETKRHSPPPATEETRAELEDRLRRLEDALSQLNQQRQAPPQPQAPVAAIVATPTPQAPITTTPAPTASSFLFGVGRQMFSGATAPAAQAPQVPLEPVYTVPMNWPFFFYEAYAEIRTIFRMYVDPRYRLSWSCRLIPLLLFALIFTSTLWAPGSSIPYVGSFIDKLIDLPLAYLMFKILSYEARRYRQTSPDLPMTLRLYD